MIYWGREISSFHFLIKNLNINHIIVDGYSPFVSHNLQFKNYYENNQEYDFITKFWGNTSLEGDLSEIKLYDFKNIKLNIQVQIEIWSSSFEIVFAMGRGRYSLAFFI